MQNIKNQKIVFSQIASLIPWYQFDKAVKEFGGDYRYKRFKSRDHLLVMIFAQLTYRDSLRSIECSLNSQREKLYHMGIRCDKVARNTIAKANEVRDYRIYEKLANILTPQQEGSCTHSRKGVALPSSPFLTFIPNLQQNKHKERGTTPFPHYLFHQSC